MNEWLRQLLFLPPQASTFAKEIDGLHYMVILTTMAGATLITIVGGLLMIRYRSRDGKPPEGRDPHWVLPFWSEALVSIVLLGIFLIWWVIGFRQFVELRVPPKNTIDIYVTGKQWMWEFSYPEGQHSIAKLVVPAGRPVKLIITARDVLHSVFIPDFRVKQDAVPGRYTTLWFEVKEPGAYPIFCAEYCGTNHSSMRGEVIALLPEDYSRWLQADTPSIKVAGNNYMEPANYELFPQPEAVSLARQGVQVAGALGCLRCHTLDGTEHIGPSWGGMYGATVPLVGGGQTIADEAFLTESMMDPMAKIHAGYRAVMPSYHGLMKPGETAAIVELIKSLKQVAAKPATPMPVDSVPRLEQAAKHASAGENL